MSLSVDNQLVQVKLYQRAFTAKLLNSNVFIANANMKYNNFQNNPASLGTSVEFPTPARGLTKNSRNATFASYAQSRVTLTVDKEISAAYSFNDKEFIYNAEEFLKKGSGEAAVMEIGAQIEKSLAEQCLKDSFRYYAVNNGSGNITTYQDLVNANVRLRNPGMASSRIKFIIPDTAAPAIVQNGLGDFAMKRNDQISNSWELASAGDCDFYTSNSLPVHIAGNASSKVALTVVSTNDPTGKNITQITVSGADNSDLDAIKENDVFTFSDGVSGQPDLRLLTFYGYYRSDTPVQARVTADAASDGSGNVILNIFPALTTEKGSTLETSKSVVISNNIVAGMQLAVAKSHRMGICWAGDPLYMAMPQQPTKSPFVTANEIDPETGCSIRMAWGSANGVGSPDVGMVYDGLWGSVLVGIYAQRVLFPIV